MSPRLLLALLASFGLVKTDDITTYCVILDGFESKYDSNLHNVISDYRKNKKSLYAFGNNYIVIPSTNYNSNSLLLKTVFKVGSEKALDHIQILEKLKDSNISTNYIGCLEIQYSYIIIQDSTYKSLSDDEMKEKFKSLDLTKKMLIILKVAILIQKLHSRGIIHNNISPLTIAATDKEISDVRLLNFGQSFTADTEKTNKALYYKHSSEIFKSSLLFDREKKKKDFNPDVFSFVNTIFTLFNPQFSLTNAHINEFKFTFDELQKLISEVSEQKKDLKVLLQSNAQVKAVKAELNRVPELKDLMDYIGAALVENKETLTMKTLIVKIVDAIENIMNKDELPELKDYLEKLRNENKLRI